MPLAKVKIAPGFDKQSTPADAEGRWVDGDNVRFRYGEPEKIGGWSALVNKQLVGAARAQHVWANTAGKRYAAIGTNKVLIIYFDGAFYDITPLDTDNFQTGSDITTTNGSATVTITTSNAHNLLVGNIVTFANAGSFTGANTDYTATDFDDKLFEIQSVPTTTTFTITMPSSESKSGVTNDGTLDVRPYVVVGPLSETAGYGWGTYFFGGQPVASTTTTMNNGGAMLVGASSVVLTNSSLFPASGKIRIGSEDMEYTTNTTGTNTISGITRGINGTTPAEHANGSTVTDITEFVGWGDASSTTSVTIEPGNWSLDNFGNILIATVHNGETFTWDASLGTALQTRATIGTGMPTQSVMSIVSDRDRHLFHLGTQSTIGSSPQDKMFIRFSDQESISVYEPTSTNTAGTFRLDDGTRIVGAFKGKDYILVLTDTATYEMQFVGPPFTFSIRKVGSNNGLIGQHAGVFANGAVYWMGKTGGFYVYDGTVKSIPCLVEDFVFTTTGNNPGINYNSGQIIYGGINELYSEINWFYPTANSSIIDRVVTYNYAENVWTTGTLDRTTWVGSTVYEQPYATDFNESNTPTFPVVNGVSNGATIYYEHEAGLNQLNGDGTETAITSFIKSGEFDLNGRQGVPGDGEFIMSIKRFLPDFKRISGNAKITIFLNQFPQGTTASSSPLGPFTLSSTTSKVDTRARARLVAVQVENEGLNESWRYGSFRFDIRPDGRR
tara:strand:+ start:7846 stop:10023 length:2178 start_codon:yes stop_codon:yes gene_type:complete